jgi:predicted AAA+ superfamily ATPase
VGVVDPLYERYFVVKRSVELYDKILKGGLYLFHAPRQSGKSTTILQIGRKLIREGFEVI